MAGDIELATLIGQLPPSTITRLLGIDQFGQLVIDIDIRTDVNKNTVGVQALNDGLIAEREFRSEVDDYLARTMTELANNEITARLAGDEELSTRFTNAIANERDERSRVDSSLFDRISDTVNAEARTRGEVDASLDKRITDEILVERRARGEVDASLDKRITDTVNGLDTRLSAAIDAERIARGEVDDFLAKQISDTVNGLDTRLSAAIDAERIARGEVDDFLNDRITDEAIAEQNLRKAGDADLKGGFGSLIDVVTAYSGYQNGALPFGANDGRNTGWRIPPGLTGLNSFLQFSLPINRAVATRLSRRKLKITMAFATSDPYVGAIRPAMAIDSVTGVATQLPIADLKDTKSAGRRVFEFSVTMPASVPGIGSLKPYVVCDGGIAATEQFIILAGLQMAIEVTLSDDNTTAQEMGDIFWRRSVDQAMPDGGAIYPDSKIESQVFNGATYRLTPDFATILGFNIPAGSTGHNSFLQSILELSPAEQALLTGCTLAFDFDVYCSTGYNLPFVDGTLLSPTAFVNMTRNELVAPNRRIITFEGFIASDVRVLNPYLQVKNETALGTSVFIEISSISYRIVKSSDPLRTVAQIATQWAGLRSLQKSRPLSDKIDAALVNRRLRAASAIVSPTNGVSISAATASFPNPTSINRGVAKVKAGDYSFVNSIGRHFTDIVGDGRAITRIRAHAPANTPVADIIAYSGLEYYWTGDLEGVYLSAKNRRYAVHSDNPNHPAGYSQVIRDCIIEHLGNDEAVAYQTSISGRPGDVWAVTHAWGTGTSAGWDLRAERSVFIGGSAAIGVHNFTLQAEPSKMSLFGCTLTARDPGGAALAIQNLGSGQADVIEIVGCSMTGDITYLSYATATDLANQPAAHNDFSVTGYGNTPTVFINNETGRALKIASNLVGASSAIVLGGSALPILTGQQIFTKPGAKGIAGYVYGWADIAEHGVGLSFNVFITSLGKRLGDCSNSPKILTVQVNGGSTYNIVFNKNYINATNASILAEMNFVLGSAATASEYNIGGRYRPHFTDEERTLLNSSDTAILMGMACAYNGDGQRNIRAMTSNDPEHLFAGVAWEDIYPSAHGRVKEDGALPVSDLLGLGAVSAGAVLGVGSTPGQWVSGAARGLMRAVSPNAIRFIGKNR